MKYPNTQNPGSGDNLNQKQASQENGPPEVLPEKEKGGVAPEKIIKQANKTKAHESARDKQPRKPGSSDFLPSED